MVGEPVQQCAGQTFRAEYPGPFVERQVGGHQSGAALVTLAEHLEQQFGAGFTERNKAEFVDDQQAVFSQLLLEAQLEVTLLAWHRSNEASRRLATIPGVGVITATALVATIGDSAQFRSGRQLSAWLGLVPRQHSSGGKDRLGRISKRGDGYIRRLLVHGARSVLRWRRAKPGTRPGWSDRLLARRPTNVVLVAMANKTARVAWALLRYERIYRPTHA